MITIFKNKKDIPLNKEYIELNDIFFNQNTATKLDDRAEKYVQMIDGSELLSKYKIRSRFEDITLNTDQLSTGCKTVLNVLYFPDKVFCLKECGNNALEILYGFEAKVHFVSDMNMSVYTHLATKHTPFTYFGGAGYAHLCGHYRM